MTTQEAIRFGEMYLEMNEDSKDSDTYQFIEAAIKALKQKKNCELTAWGECSYNETGCSECAIKAKITKLLIYTESDDLVSRQVAIDAVEESRRLNHHQDGKEACAHEYEHRHFLKILRNMPSAQPKGYIRVPDTGIDDLSDGFHTFRQLYYQRMMLFAVIVKQNKNRAWKSLRHEDGELCFGGGWFIVGIDTPEGSYTYHYEDNFYSLFDCEELECAKHWDGHTEKDVTRLLSLPSAQNKGEWIPTTNGERHKCSTCLCIAPRFIDGEEWLSDFCPNCGSYNRR